MEAQKIITMSINKITGSRGQRGGVNLRKNLLVATVLHSARAMYYEEVCKRMARYAELNSNETASDDEDCTEAPHWGDGSESSSRVDGQSACRAEACQHQQQQQQPMEEDKENCQPETSPLQARLEKEKHEADSASPVADLTEAPAPDKDRPVLGQKSDNSPVANATSCSACKRKRSDSAEELREACESILPKRAKCSDSECGTTEELAAKGNSTVKQNSEGSITSLVTIFKSGFHGLSGEGSNASTNAVSSSSPSSTSTNHLQQSSYTAMPRPFEQLQMPIAAC